MKTPHRASPGAAGFPGRLLLVLLVAVLAPVFSLPASAQANQDYLDRAIYNLYATGTIRARFGDWAGALQDFERAYRLKPLSPELLTRYGESLWRNGRLTEAMKYAERAVMEDSSTADAWLILSEAALSRNDLAAADRYLSRRVDLKPDDLESRLKLGFLREGVGNAEGVVDAFRGYPARRPGSAAAQFHLGVAYSRLDRKAEARQAFRSALRENPGYVDAAQNVAVLSEELGEDSEAIAAWGRVLEIDATREEALRRRIMLLMQAERFPEASADLQKLLRLNPDKDGALRRLLAQIAVRTGELGVAARAMLGLADLRGNETGYLEVAIVAAQARTETDVLTRALERAWSLGLRPEVGRLLLAAYLSMGDDTGAASVLHRLHAAHPGDTTLLWSLGLIQHRLGNAVAAESAMLEVIERDPRNAGALNFVGYSWVDRNVELERAGEFIRRALDVEPENAEYIDSLGWLWFRLGRYNEAIAELEKARTLAPDEPVIGEHLGDVYSAVGRLEEALEAYRDAAAAGSHPQPLQLQEKIRSLENRLAPVTGTEAD